jgi:hypothetical protein
LFAYFNKNSTRCYLVNILSLGLYGACYVVARAKQVGEICGVKRPGLRISILLTVLTLGIYPAVMLSVLAFDLGKATSTSVGIKVLLLNAASAITAFGSSGILIILSVVLWAHAFWQIIQAETMVISSP